MLVFNMLARVLNFWLLDVTEKEKKLLWVTDAALICKDQLSCFMYFTPGQQT